MNLLLFESEQRQHVYNCFSITILSAHDEKLKKKSVKTKNRDGINQTEIETVNQTEM